MYVNPDEEIDAAGDLVMHRDSMIGEMPILSPRGGTAFQIDGTIDATIDPHDPHFYGKQSQMLIANAPVARSGGDTRKIAMRTKDLIDELQIINSQIHQIMFQVERAVSRLATN